MTKNTPKNGSFWVGHNYLKSEDFNHNVVPFCASTVLIVYFIALIKLVFEQDFSFENMFF